MAINRNNWKPDTCKCQFEYEWDSSIDSKDRVHTVVNFIPCVAHINVTDKHLCYDAVLKENQLKNKVHKELMLDPDLTIEYVDAMGNFRKRFKQGIQYKWSFDQDRKLNVEIIGVDAIKKDALKATLEAIFTGGIKIQ